MKKTFEALNLIMNGRFIHLYENASQEKKEYLLKRVGELSEELAKYRNNKNSNLYMYFCNITTSIAVLEYDISHGVPREDSIQEMTKYMQEFMAPSKEKYHKMFQKKWLWPILRVLLPKAICSSNGEGFHSFTIRNKNKDTIVFYTDKCMFNSILREKGMLDLAKSFCRIDEYMYGDIPGVKFVRLGTLCNDAENCDFCFCREFSKKGKE